jgi:hypothetical protein
MSQLQAKQTTGKRIGKRTYTLKELAQRDFTSHPKAKETAPKLDLVNIQEDLLDGQETRPLSQSAANADNNTGENQGPIRTNDQKNDQNLALTIKLVNQLITKEISKTADSLDMDASELQAWIDLQVMTPCHTLLALLRIARQYHLDPLKEEVALALYDDCHWQAYITVEGYSKLLNNHPAFDGITFTQSQETTNGIPIWMECTIYRKDRSRPIVVREYFEEVKGEQAVWEKMPRRMLRHRVMQQCARLAMG